MMRGNRGATLLRLLTALVLIPLTLALIWAPWVDAGFSLFIALLGAIGMREFFEMAGAKGLRAEQPVALVAGSLLILSGQFGSPRLAELLLFLAFVAIAVSHLVRRNHSLPGICTSVFGLIYVAWLASYIVMLHQLPAFGPALVTLLIVAVALADTGAYFTGKTIGRHKLAPSVSPNKTIEGAVGGIACAMLGMAALFSVRAQFGWELFPAWSLWRYVLTGVLLAVLSQIGDLAESMLKRDAGIKDAGGIFPGHGGVLDRCDGFLFTAPLLYWLAAL